MVEGGIYTIIVPIGRALAAFLVGLMLGIVGGWIALTFNALIEFPWSMAVHRNIYLVAIGLGAGIGAYLCWMNLALHRYLVLASVLAVLAGGIAGTYSGYLYGHNIEPTYLGRAYTIDNTVHLGATIGGAGVATILGIINEVRTLGR